MKKMKAAALFTALCLSLCGCNFNSDNPSIDETTENVTTPEYTEEITTEISENNTSDNATSSVYESSDGNGGTSTIDTSDSQSISEESSADTNTAASSSTVSNKPIVSATEVQTTAVQTTQNVPTETQPPVVTTTAAPVVPSEPSPPTIYGTTADGVLTTGNELATVDYSNTADGYIMAKYTGSVSLIKIQITNPAGTTQTYTLNSNGQYEAFPLTGNNGNYSFRVLESVAGTGGYALAHSGSFQVQLSNSLAPYLRPSSYVPFSYGDSAVTKSSELCGGAANDLEKVDRVYSWLVDNVVYDSELAGSKIAGGYVADTEKVINKKKGICLDYAGTMAAMLRSQNIPVQVVSGHASGTKSLHAWVNVYITDVGWVYGAIYFDGSEWHRMDPTFAASSHSNSAILSYIGDGNNYYAEQFN